MIGTEQNKRPLALTIVCLLGLIGPFVTAALMFSPEVQQVGVWYPPYLGFAAIITLTCMIGLWMMRKWAAYTYTGFVVLSQVLLLTMGLWNLTTLLVPALVVFIALMYVSKMS